MLARYLIKLAIRVSVFGATLFLYLTDETLMVSLMSCRIWNGITPLHVLWFMFMFMMAAHLFPRKELTMALWKSRNEKYIEETGYSELELWHFVKDMNQKAWKVMLVWLSFNAVFGTLYLFDIIGQADLLMLTVFYFLCDYICILFFCPFQTIIMKNRCCVNCRIYDWGHFMMFTPMLFIQSFYTWSLFFMSIIVLIRWEIFYARHPERFWYGSNKQIQCANCQDKTCQIKKKLAG